MTAVPVPATFSVGQIVTAADENDIRDCLRFALTPPRCHAYDGAGQSYANNTWTLGALTSEVYDTDPNGLSMHNTVTNTSVIVCNYTGIYVVEAFIDFPGNATGRRAVQVRVNSAGNVASGTLVKQVNVNPAAGPLPTTAAFTQDWSMTAGDYFQFFGYQDSGGALAATAGPGKTGMIVRLVAAVGP